MTKFVEETIAIKTQYRVLRKEQQLLSVALRRMEGLAMSAEDALTRIGISLKVCNIE